MRKGFLTLGLFFLLGAGCGEPKTATLDVPFTSQAPAGDWSEPWQNACEETSIAMVASFYSGEVGMTPEEASADIRKILDVKNRVIGTSSDESVETISRLIAELGEPWTSRVVIDPTIRQLEKEIEARHPVIVPVFAPTLHNKKYEAGEPDYHVIVLIGYDQARKEFIVNDPGTVSGNGLRFSYDALMDAMHDLDRENYRAGRKAVLFTEGSATSSPI